MSTTDADAYSVYREEAARYPMVTEAEELRLAARIRAGDSDALTCLVNANLRIVLSLVQSYAPAGSQVARADLVAEGNIGLMHAAKNFDGRGRFYNYAIALIHRYMKKHMAHACWAVRVPLDVHTLLGKLHRVATLMEEQSGVVPTSAELAEEVGMEEHKVESLRMVMRKAKGLHVPLGGGDDGEGAKTLGDTLSDGRFERLDGEQETEARLQDVETVMAELDARARLLLQARHGLTGHEPMTLEQVGSKFSVSKEHVRQTQAAAEREIRRAF